MEKNTETCQTLQPDNGSSNHRFKNMTLPVQKILNARPKALKSPSLNTFSSILTFLRVCIDHVVAWLYWKLLPSDNGSSPPLQPDGNESNCSTTKKDPRVCSKGTVHSGGVSMSLDELLRMTSRRNFQADRVAPYQYVSRLRRRVISVKVSSQSQNLEEVKSAVEDIVRTTLCNRGAASTSGMAWMVRTSPGRVGQTAPTPLGGSTSVHLHTQADQL